MSSQVSETAPAAPDWYDLMCLQLSPGIELHAYRRSCSLVSTRLPNTLSAE